MGQQKKGFNFGMDERVSSVWSGLEVAVLGLKNPNKKITLLETHE